MSDAEKNTPTTLQNLKDNALESLKNDYVLSNVEEIMIELAGNAVPDYYHETLELLTQEGNDLHITMPENLPEELTPIAIANENIRQEIYYFLHEHMDEVVDVEDIEDIEIANNSESQETTMYEESKDEIEIKTRLKNIETAFDAFLYRHENYSDFCEVDIIKIDNNEAIRVMFNHILYLSNDMYHLEIGLMFELSPIATQPYNIDINIDGIIQLEGYEADYPIIEILKGIKKDIMEVEIDVEKEEN